MDKFGDADFLIALNDYITNPSVTGFFIEQAVLSSIAANGLEISEQDFEVVPVFIWVTKEDSEVETVDAEYRLTRLGRKLVHPSFRRQKIPLEMVNLDISERYQRVLGRLQESWVENESLDVSEARITGGEEQRMSKEPEGPEEQAKSGVPSAVQKPKESGGKAAQMPLEAMDRQKIRVSRSPPGLRTKVYLNILSLRVRFTVFGSIVASANRFLETSGLISMALDVRSRDDKELVDLLLQRKNEYLEASLQSCDGVRKLPARLGSGFSTLKNFPLYYGLKGGILSIVGLELPLLTAEYQKNISMPSRLISFEISWHMNDGTTDSPEPGDEKADLIQYGSTGVGRLVPEAEMYVARVFEHSAASTNTRNTDINRVSGSISCSYKDRGISPHA
ncbi:hypothetical protein V8E54_006769 [Elaphomyces granulatus]